MNLERGRAYAFGVPPHALPAYRNLLTVLAQDDYAAPCAAEPEAWTGEDPEDRAAAASACLGCSAFVACGQYADAAQETSGVWAGVDRSPRRGRRPAATTTSKEAAA